MKIYLITNEGDSNNRYVELREGTTVGGLIHEHARNQSPGAYSVRVNQSVRESCHILQDGDRVTLTPTKVGGGER